MGFLRRVVVLAAAIFAALAAQTNGTRGARPYTTWTVYGGAADSSQYSALDQINQSNVSRLQVVRRRQGFADDRSPDAARSGGRGGRAGPIITPQQKAQLTAQMKTLLAAGGPVRLESPYEFMNQNSIGMSAAGPPWSEMTAYDLNTGAIKWRIPTGTVVAPPELRIPPNTGSHFPRAAPLVTAGGLVFFATGSDRRFRAYDRDNGRELWSMELAAASEGMPATYAIDGRQFIVVPVAAGSGMFSARFGGPVQSGRGAAASAIPGQYVALALKQ